MDDQPRVKLKPMATTPEPARRAPKASDASLGHGIAGLRAPRAAHRLLPGQEDLPRQASSAARASSPDPIGGPSAGRPRGRSTHRDYRCLDTGSM